MKWTFVIQQKLKVALLLGVIMCVIVCFNLILQKNISDINKSVASIYNDRLIPATDIFYISENLHHRQLLLENYLYRQDQDHEQLQAILHQHSDKMNQLITKYEKTYLVDQETAFLKRFKHDIAEYSALENRIISLTAVDSRKADGISLYESAGRSAIENTISQLSDLTTIQSAVGNKLVNDTKGIVATSNILSDLQIVLAIIIGTMITALIVSSKIINQSQTKFNLN